jgi:hypothetical protein
VARRPHPPAAPGEFRDPITGYRIRPLTAESANHWPLSAPDTPLTPTGDCLLFLSDRGGTPHPNLFRLAMPSGAVDPVTGTDRLVPEGITPAANGRQAIALLRGEEGEVVAIDLEIGDAETLAVFLDAQLEGCHRSASGEYVVTVVTHEEEAVITAVHTQGMRTVPILEASRGAHAARFSPDSKNSILYVTDDPAEIRCVEFDGTGDRLLYSGVQAGHPPAPRVPGLNAAPIWRGSGDELLFIAPPGPGSIMAVPRRGGSPRLVCALPCVWVRSNGDGERLVALVAAEEEAGDLPASPMVLIHARSGEVTPLVSGCGAGARPCFSPDGQSVVFASRDDRGYVQIYQVFLQDDERP